jgi:transposase
MIITEIAEPSRVARLGPARLRTFAANRGVRMTTPLAERIVEAARQALPVPGAEVSRQLLAADLRLLDDAPITSDVGLSLVPGLPLPDSSSDQAN